MKKILTYKNFINESLQEETRNVAKPGDYIIRAKTKAGEEYVVKGEKFSKLYDIKSEKEPTDSNITELGFKEYKVIPEQRKAIVCDRETLDLIKSKIDINKTTSQKNMLNLVKLNDIKSKIINVSKRESAYAKKVEKEVDIITKVEKGKDIEFYFEAPWGGTMPVAENDILIIRDGEVYRIARSEFNQTYNEI